MASTKNVVLDLGQQRLRAARWSTEVLDWMNFVVVKEAFHHELFKSSVQIIICSTTYLSLFFPCLLCPVWRGSHKVNPEEKRDAVAGYMRE